jgi:metal-dependent amidase/aminoacylase/carboxypeptidase family protein
MEPEKKRAIEWIDDQSERLINISQEIWDFAELGLEEFKSSALLVKVLRDVGFNVEEGVSGMPTEKGNQILEFSLNMTRFPSAASMEMDPVMDVVITFWGPVQ